MSLSIEEKENIDKTTNELQHNIADCERTILENLWKLLSKAKDNLKEEMLECNFADHKNASLCNSFTEANDKLMKAVSEHNGLEQCASHYKRECNDNDQKVKKFLERRLDDRESEIVDFHHQNLLRMKQGCLFICQNPLVVKFTF